MLRQVLAPSGQQKFHQRVGELAKLGKCNHEVLNMIPSTHVKRHGRHLCRRDRDWWITGSLTSKACLIGELQAGQKKLNKQCVWEGELTPELGALLFERTIIQFPALTRLTRNHL